MKSLRFCSLLTTLVFTVAMLGQSAKIAPAKDGHETKAAEAPATVASAVDRDISGAEKPLVDAAEAMPEEKYAFSPEGLGIPGAAFKGVRSFALQIRHVAASNYAIWSYVTGDKFPDDYKGGDGPANLKTKAEIVQFLKDSFAQGHKAAATLTVQNMLQSAGSTKLTRLQMTMAAITHANDHYGQVVEYLRMNGIVPPASR